MGGPSERDFIDKMNKIREKILRTEREVNDSFAKIERIKLEALKKTEEMRQATAKDLEKVEKDILKSEELVAESKQRLKSESNSLKAEIDQGYNELKTRLTKAIAPR